MIALGPYGTSHVHCNSSVYSFRLKFPVTTQDTLWTLSFSTNIYWQTKSPEGPISKSLKFSACLCILYSYQNLQLFHSFLEYNVGQSQPGYIGLLSNLFCKGDSFVQLEAFYQTGKVVWALQLNLNTRQVCRLMTAEVMVRTFLCTVLNCRRVLNRFISLVAAGIKEGALNRALR